MYNTTLPIIHLKMQLFHFWFSTLKQGCNAGIQLCLSEDKQCLKVTEVNEEHNHVVSKVSFTSCPYMSLILCEVIILH